MLHGLGSVGEKFGVEFLESGIPSNGASLADSLPGMKFIFPTAQRGRCSAFKRALINQWFNLASLEDPVRRTDMQVSGLSESARYVQSILSQEMEIIPPQNIILGGLSQGCAMAIFVLLSLEFPIGGFVGMSGWLPFEQDLSEIVQLGDTEDGEADTDLFKFGEELGHWYGVPDEIDDILGFLRDTLAL